MNTKLLRKVQKYIMQEPHRYNMSSWIAPIKFAYDKTEDQNPPCGTVCCIAGAAYIISTNSDIKTVSVGSVDLYITAVNNLQLNQAQTDRLFYTQYWPKKFKTSYYEVKTSLSRAKVGVARIEHFIKTRGEE